MSQELTEQITEICQDCSYLEQGVMKDFDLKHCGTCGCCSCDWFYWDISFKTFNVSIRAGKEKKAA